MNWGGGKGEKSKLKTVCKYYFNMDVAKRTFAQLLISQGEVSLYYIPKYQREYAWRKWNLEALYDDIEEDDKEHFMGSIICIARKKPQGYFQVYDVVDGQQRLTTLSILLMAIYEKYRLLNEVSDKRYISKLVDLSEKLLSEKDEMLEGEKEDFIEDGVRRFIRVKPSTQNKNLDDYLFLLSSCGLIKESIKIQPYHSVRLMAKALDYFRKRVPSDRQSLEALLNKIYNLVFIHISVESHANAHMMFETLNNRGMPLTAIDIIKNKALAELERNEKQDMDASYKQWQKIIDNLPDSEMQMRFLRQYYNAHQFLRDQTNIGDFYLPVKVDGHKLATKSRLINIYESIIDMRPKWIMNDLIIRSAWYKELTDPENLAKGPIRDQLLDLQRVGAAPGYTSLMIFYGLYKDGNLEESTFASIINFYVKYFFRRNITDTPPTRDLDTFQIQLSEKIFQRYYNNEPITLDWFYQLFEDEKGRPADLGTFVKNLKESLYESNRDMTRFVLIKLCEIHANEENRRNFWGRSDKGKYLWTIEHVFPQGEDIPLEWVQMIANGERELAEKIRQEEAGKLGNLTLSAFNSNLSNARLEVKQQKQTQNTFGKDLVIGYQNGLSINNLFYEIEGQKFQLANTPSWNAAQINARTNALIELIKDYFSLPTDKNDSY